jgi:hypothetical protein
MYPLSFLLPLVILNTALTSFSGEEAEEADGDQSLRALPVQTP